MNPLQIFKIMKEQQKSFEGPEWMKATFVTYGILCRLLYVLLRDNIIKEKTLIWIVKGE